MSISIWKAVAGTAAGVAIMIAGAAFMGLGPFTEPAEITKIPPIRDKDGNEVEGGLASLEKVMLGGVEQWILIRAQDPKKPVLLVLHGGPGGALMPWVDLFQKPLLEENFVVVHWDQRGAGKSFYTELTVEDLTPAKYVADTLELTTMLRARFGQEKIFLTGHSWGSALGFFTLAEDSSPYLAYIPTSERVEWDRSFIMGFDWAKSQAEKTGDAEILVKLQAVEPFDPLNEDHLVVQREALAYYGAEDFHTEGLEDKYYGYALGGESPYYTSAELNKYIPGLELSSAAIEIPEIVGNYNQFRDFPKADIPVHFIVGEFDQNTPGELAREYFEELEAPDKSFTVIDGAAHMVMWDAPDAWAETLVDIADRVLEKQE